MVSNHPNFWQTFSPETCVLNAIDGLAYLINKMTMQLNFLNEVIDTIGTGTDGVVLILFSPDSIKECLYYEGTLKRFNCILDIYRLLLNEVK